MGFLSFFSAKKEQIDTIIKPHRSLEEYALLHQLSFYKSIPIFHRNNYEEIISILFDSHRGLYLFDSVPWKMNEIENATVSSTLTDNNTDADVYVDEIHDFIQRKFNEVLHREGCAIAKLLILEYISKENFEDLDESFHTLMPKTRLIFADDTPKEIEEKLHNALTLRKNPLETVTLLGALFFHLNIMPDNLHKENALLTQEQHHFIANELASFSTLCGNYGTGKSTLILIKSIYELLLHPAQKIIIIMPTLAACDMLKKQLLDIIEYAIIDIDLLSIQIITPQQVIAQHYQKLYKNESFSFAKITPKMFKHQYQCSDIIFCDDSYLMDKEFVHYLIKQQSKKKLCLVLLQTDNDPSYTLTHSFRSPKTFLQLCSDNAEANSHMSSTVHSLRGNPYMHIMLLFRKLLKESDHSQLLIAVPHSQFALKLLDEINSYYGSIAFIYQADEGLLKQSLDHILIATINELSHLQREHVIVVKDNDTDEAYTCHAIGRASKSLYLISSEPEDKSYE